MFRPVDSLWEERVSLAHPVCFSFLQEKRFGPVLRFSVVAVPSSRPVTSPANSLHVGT